MSSKNSEHTLHRSGFVCLAGPTNAGKSTLMNAVIGEKVAIISPKPQTTRNRILGIHSLGERGQLIFVDTPGLHNPKGKLGERMVDVAMRSIKDADSVLLVVDVSLDVAGKETPARVNQRAIEQLKERWRGALVVALNKVDKVRSKPLLLPVIEAYRDLTGASDIFPISATRNTGLDELEECLYALLPEGPLLYPADLISDQAERFMAAEVIREKIILETEQEIPYSVAVEVEQWTEPSRKGAALRIAAVICVERKSQKGIIIGKQGARLKSIATAARLELEAAFATPVFLELFVKVEPDWSKKPKQLDHFGYK